MRAFLPLLKVYVSSVYNPRAFLEAFRQGPKGIAKGLGMVFLVCYAVLAFGFMMVVSSYSSYSGLKPLGLESLVLLSAVSTATAIVLILGFVTCLATYFMSEAESFLLAMPIRPADLFGAKLAMTYLSEAALAILMIGAGAGVYAFFERPPFLFYVHALLIALATPVLPLSAFYILLVPLMTRVRLLRRKDTVMLLGGILGIGMAIGWQLFYQRMMMNANDPEWLLANLADPDSVLRRFASAFPPALLAAKALSAPGSLSGLASLASFLGVQALGLALAMLLLPGPYARSLAGFNESYLKRLSSSGDYIGRAFRSRSALPSFFLREVRQMNREPVFFLNGPFIVILMPLLLGVVYGSMRDRLLSDVPGLGGPDAVPYVALAAFILSAWLGSANGISCTAISREGTQFAFLKVLPLDARAYLGAKLLHALAFGLVAAITGPCLAGFLVPAGAARLAEAGFGGFGVSCLLNVAGLALDTANPRLSWPNPTVAIKQNVNYVIMSLGGMALSGGMAALLALFLLRTPFLYAILGVAGLAAAAGAFALYLKWAPGRIARIEP